MIKLVKKKIIAPKKKGNLKFWLGLLARRLTVLMFKVNGCYKKLASFYTPHLRMLGRVRTQTRPKALHL